MVKFSKLTSEKKKNDQLENEKNTGEDISLENVQVASKHVKRCAASPAGRESPLHTLERLTHKTSDHLSTSKHVKKLDHSSTAGGKANLAVSRTSKLDFPYDPTMALMGLYPQRSDNLQTSVPKCS